MNAVAFATRRLWIRRSRRTWLLATKISEYVVACLPPMWVFWFERAWYRSWKNTGSDMFIGGLIVNVVVALVAGGVSWQMYLGRDATVEELRAARAADGCFDDTIVRRAKAWNRPVTVRDVRATQDDCANMWDDIARKKAQAAVLSQQLEK